MESPKIAEEVSTCPEYKKKETFDVEYLLNNYFSEKNKMYTFMVFVLIRIFQACFAKKKKFYLGIEPSTFRFKLLRSKNMFFFQKRNFINISFTRNNIADPNFTKKK